MGDASPVQACVTMQPSRYLFLEHTLFCLIGPGPFNLIKVVKFIWLNFSRFIHSFKYGTYLGLLFTYLSM